MSCDDFDAVTVSQISVDPECDLFFVASNNVTIVCPDVMIGETGYVGDVQYTKRDKDRASGQSKDEGTKISFHSRLVQLRSAGIGSDV